MTNNITTRLARAAAKRSLAKIAPPSARSARWAMTLIIALLTAATAWATTTSTINVGGTDYTLFTGFTATDGNGTNYAKLVDGNTTSDWSATKNYDDPNAPANDFAGGTADPAFVEFHADEAFIPKGYVLTCDHVNAGFWKPVEWALKAKLNEGDAWTTIQSSTTTLGAGKTFQIPCTNDGDNEYQYFRFEVYEVGTTMTVDLDELQFYGLLPAYTHLTVKAATCMATGIKQDCYRRNSDGKYFTDNTGETEIPESDVIAPIIPHTGEHNEATDVNIEYWQCSMCSKYFSDEGYTTEITEEQTKIYRTITIDSSISGLVTVAFSKTQALAGETVYLFVSDLIDASTLKVNNGAVELTAKTDIQYTFTMPAADVTVTADVAQSNADGDVLTGSIRHTVTIPDGASITLNNATITGSIVCEGSATITLVGTNSVSGATNKAGIQIGGSGTTLTINGDGTLTANGGSQSAGIGLSRAWNVTEDVVGGNIVINGGNITANGGGGGAGIGAGVTKDPNNSSSRKAIVGTITIAGGSVTAVGGSNADGIGAGENNYNATIQIGTVTIYDGIDKVDASSIKDFGSVVYMHGETNVTANKTDYFAIGEDGNRRLIAQKPAIAEIADQTYTGSEITPEPQVTIGSLSLTKSTDYEYSYTNNTNVGTATVTVTFQGDYESLGYVEKTFTIGKATPTVTAPTANTLTYTGEAQALVTAGSTDFGTLVYSLEENGTYTADIPTATDAGTYTVYYKVEGSDNWNAVDAQTVEVTIAPRTYTVTFDANGGEGTMEPMQLTYNGDWVTLTANTFTRSGYGFKEWNTEPDGSGTAYYDEEEVYNLTDEANGNVVLYAQWGKNIATCDIKGTLEAYDDGYGPYYPLSNNVEVWDGDTQLTLDTDYTIELDPDVDIYSYEVGEQYQATVTGMGDWGGTKTFTFTMVALHHTVMFDANGGTGTMADDIVANNSGYAGHYYLPECGFTAPACLVFDHWEVSYEGITEDPIKQPGEYFTAPYIYQPSDIQTITVTAHWRVADELPAVNYIDADGEQATKQPGEYTVLTGGGATTLGAGWYVATGIINYTGSVTLTGNVTLILADNCHMNVGTSGERINGYGIDGPDPGTGGFHDLTITSQSLGSDMGALNIYTTGSDKYGIRSGALTINGGNITADTNGKSAIALNASGALTINGGTVNATTAGTTAHAIAAAGDFKYNGGNVTATAPNGNAIRADIGNYTFSWRTPADRITIGATGLYAPAAKTATFTRLFTDATNIYSSELTGSAINALAGKTLQPAYDITLLDNADNSATIGADYLDGVTQFVTLQGRTLYKDGAWNTLCLPFAVDLTDENGPLYGATAKTLTDATMTGTHVTLTFSETPVTTLEAGKPYIIKWDGDGTDNIVEPVFTGVTVVSSSAADRTITKADGHVKFIGYYDPFTIDTPANDDIYYMTADNTLKHTGKQRTLKACRAYFQFSENIVNSAREFVLDFGEETTALTLVNSEQGIVNSGVYDLQGRKVSNPSKGLYIRNGKKVVIK